MIGSPLSYRFEDILLGDEKKQKITAIKTVKVTSTLRLAHRTKQATKALNRSMVTSHDADVSK
jgi:hypothetical protein